MVELLVQTADHSPPTLVVRKTVCDETRLTAQVRWLTRAQGSGVVRLHRVAISERTYSTVYAGSTTLAMAGSHPVWAAPATMALVVGELWSTLERLHRVELVHGAVHADHVILGAMGPTLISPGVSPSGNRADDIADVGALVRDQAQMWSVGATIGDGVIDRWAEVGRELLALGEHGSSRFVSPGEVRVLLEALPTAPARQRLRSRRCG